MGLAPSYYYEASSWAEAERHGRLNLARTWRVGVRELQKVDSDEGQEISEEDLDVTLRGAAAVARWRDVRAGIYTC